MFFPGYPGRLDQRRGSLSCRNPSHDNNGAADEHLPVGGGSFPFFRLFRPASGEMASNRF